MINHPEVEAIWGPNPLCERGYAFALNSSPDGRKIIYGSGPNAVLRDSSNTSECFVSTAHRSLVYVGKFANSGSQVMTSDAHGGVILHDIKNGKLEVNKRMSGMGGRIYDLAWYANDKGYAVAGDSKGQKGAVFTLSGNSQGSISATKRVTSVDIYFYDDDKKKVQEAKIVTASDDLKLRFYKYNSGFSIDESGAVKTTFKTNCNMVRFSPCGKYIVAVGGKEIKLLSAAANYKSVCATKGDKKKQEHAGNVYAVAWSSDGSGFLTASSDKTVKYWAVKGDSFELVSTLDFKGKSDFGPSQADFQVGCCYVGDGVKHEFASLSMSGDINFITVGGELQLKSTVVASTAELAAIDVNLEHGTIAVASHSGEVIVYDKGGVASRIKGVKDPKRCVGVVNFGTSVVSTGWDDVVRSFEGKTLKGSSRTLALGGQPLDMCRSSKSAFFAVCTKENVYVVDSGSPDQPFAQMKAGNAEFTAVGLNEAGDFLVVGTSDKKVRFYQVAKGSITDKGVDCEELLTPASCVAVQGKHVAVGLKNKYVMLFATDGTTLADGWSKHTNTVTDVDFSPDGAFLLSAGLEGDINVWDVSKPKKFKPLKNFKLAHPTGVAGAKFIDNTTFYTAGSGDGTVKRFVLKL